MPSDWDRHIEHLLDQAGHDAQPRSNGWDALPAKLALIRQVGRRRFTHWATLAGAAAVIITAIGIVSYMVSGPAALAELQPIQVIRQDVEITVFNETETERPTLFMPIADPQPQQTPTVKSGMALVKDHRIVMNLLKGDNIVRFTDVAETIDPTSVRFVSETDPTSTLVVEQNFEYDLATADALLKRYIDKQVTCTAQNDEQYEGYLCSYDHESIVLADKLPRSEGGDRKTQTISRNQLRALRLDEVPKDLFVRPTLVWKIRTQLPGRHDTTLTYICGQMKWAADYVALVTPGDIEKGDRLDLQGWVTIDNRSGSTYREAGIKLIAGEVNRVPDPWAPGRRITEEYSHWFFADSSGPQSLVVSGTKAFVEKAFFEYHLYTLSAPSTVKDRQIKQLKLLKADGIRVTRRYVFDPQADQNRVAVYLEFKNEKDNELGMPLPKGLIRLMQRDADEDVQFIGSNQIDHTPKDEDVELKLGKAFDVTAERTVQDTKWPTNWRKILTIQLRMRNHKDEAINVRIVERMEPHLNWSITQTTDPWTRKDVDTVHFDFVLGPNQEKEIIYKVDYQW